MSVEMSDLETYLNSAVDLDPIPVASGRPLKTWWVRNCEYGWVRLETQGQFGASFSLSLKPIEVKEQVAHQPDKQRPLWKLHHRLTHDGRRWHGSKNAE